MEKLPGIESKADQYAIRIINGEKIEDVLEGAEVFRSEVEARIKQYEEKKSAERTAEENDGLPQSTQTIEQRITDDNTKIEELRNQLSKESGELSYELGDEVLYNGAKHKIIDIIDHPYHKQQTGEALKVYHLENEVGTAIQEGGVRKYVTKGDLKQL